MRLINSNGPEILVAVELNGQEVADLYSLASKVANWDNDRDVPTVRDTTRSLLLSLQPLFRQYQGIMPEARTCNGLYISNNLRMVPREQPRQAQAVPARMVDGQLVVGGPQEAPPVQEAGPVPENVWAGRLEDAVVIRPRNPGRLR